MIVENWSCTNCLSLKWRTAVTYYSQEVCYQYWPSSGNQQYGEYSVDLLGEEELERHIIRTLNITHSTVELLNSKIELQKWMICNPHKLPVYRHI